MTSRRTVLPLAFALAAIPACNPYQNFDGEYYAGPIDPTRFQAPYVGVLPGTADQQGGVIAAATAYVAGAPVSYYLFPFPASQTADPMTDPLALGSSVAPTPKAYVFDPDPATVVPAKGKCTKPSKDYKFDQRAEGFRKDEQGTIFTVIPDKGGYVPIVSEVPVTSMNEPCQDIKSGPTLLSRQGKDVSMPGSGTGAAFKSKSDGKFIALAIVDPAADVQPNGPNGLGPQHLGFYNHYLVAYINGGYIPTTSAMDAMMMPYTKATTQTMYTPSMIPTKDAMMNTVAGPGGTGTGFDLIQSAPGAANYSPICHVLQYTPDNPLSPKTDIASLSPAELASAGGAMADLGFVYCLQAL